MQNSENLDQAQQEVLPETLVDDAATTIQDNAAAGSLDERIGELEAQLAEAKAAVLYVKADGENIRRRAMDDIEKARKFALEKFTNELLAVKDSLDAALLIEATDVQSYKDGVQITTKQLDAVFDKFNIAEINPLGEKFDPNKHQAISVLENSGEPNTVTSVLQKGYTLNDRVLRPALVMVAK
ncbi:MAG: nucleotide exchange factor GrpE [Pseudomonadota bacterium]